MVSPLDRLAPLGRLPRPCNKYALAYIVPPPIGLEFTVTALQLFKALADPTRLACVLTLQARGELCVCDLYARLEVSQPKMSRHLAQLRKAGLLSQRKKGLWVYYQLNPHMPAWALQILQHTAQGNPLPPSNPQASCGTSNMC